jgi:Kef-type K+ transport system membrane component KefB
MQAGQLSALFFCQMAAIILACRGVGKLAQRIGQPQVVGEMIAGVLLGPSLFGAVFPGVESALFPTPSLNTLYVVGQFAVGLYMFLVGTEFHIEKFRERAMSACAVSVAGVAAPFLLAALSVPFLIDVPGLFGDGVGIVDGGLFLGAAIAITAFPMLARIIHERGLAGTALGTLALSAGAIDDAVAWCILAVVLASHGGNWTAAGITVAGGLAYGLFVLSVGRRWLQPLGKHAEKAGDLSPALLGGVLALFCLGAWAMDAIGIHAVFGGFILGVAMPRGELTRKLRSALEPLVVVFLLPIFFTYTGLKTQLGLLLSPEFLLPTLAIFFASFAGKGGACWLAARLSGESRRDAAAVGALMNARGLMELIIINIGLQAGVIKPALFAILTFMAILSTFAATPLFNRVVRGGNAVDAADEARAAACAATNKV